MIEYSNNVDDFYKNIEEYNPDKKRKPLIVFDNMTADMLRNKKRNPILTQLFTKGRKPDISLVFITQSYFAVLKNVQLNSTRYFIMEISDKQKI